MDPSATKATLKVLGLCVVLLLVVAAVTVSVAVMMRHSEAAQRLHHCQEQAANETLALGGRVAELERDVAELMGRLEKSAQKEKQLRRQLGQAKDEGMKLNGSSMSCWEYVNALSTNVTALHDQLTAVQLEGTEMDTRHIALQAELAQWQGKVREGERQLEEALQQHLASEARKEQCEAQQRELQRTMQEYVTEIDSLHRRLSSRASGRREWRMQQIRTRGSCKTRKWLQPRITSSLPRSQLPPPTRVTATNELTRFRVH